MVGLRPDHGHTSFSRDTRRACTVALLVAAALVGFASPAFAHGTLRSSAPRAGEVLPASPTTVHLQFDERVTTVPNSVRVLDAAGRRVDDRAVRHPAGRAAELDVDLRPALAAGTYLVDWRVVSGDSHPVRGAFTFSIGAPGPVAASQDGAGSQTVGLALGTARLVSFAALALLVGGAVFLCACWPAGWQRRRPRRLLWAGWWAAATAGLAGFVLQGVYVAALPASRALDPGLLRGVATSRYGHAVVLQILLLGGAAWWLVTAARRPPSHRRLILGAAIGVALLACLAAQGHASDGMQAPLALVVVTLHLTAMSCWLGGLAVLSLCLLPAPQADRLPAGELAVAVPRFSRLALGAVGLLVATGSYQLWRQVGTLPALPATPSGRLLLAKLGAFVVLIVVAALSRSWVRRHYSSPVPSAPETTRLRRSVGAEVFLAVGILAITATLVATQPARSAYHPTVIRTVNAGLAVVRISAVPAGNRLLDLRAETFNLNGGRFDIPELTAQLRLPARDLGPLTVAFRKVGPGGFVADQVAVPVAGRWQLRLFVLTTSVNDFPAIITIRVT